MIATNDTRNTGMLTSGPDGSHESKKTAVAWPAILGGAVVASVVSLMLFMLGTGIGLASVSPWTSDMSTVQTFAISTAIWFIVMQWVSSALGGYLAGRLRTKWVDMHTDEVVFRDTAHGFLAWAVATLITVGFAVSMAASAVGSGTQAAATVAAGAATGAANGAASSMDETDMSSQSGYYIDTLFRSDRPAEAGTDTAGEMSRLLGSRVWNGELSDTDRARMAQLISNRTGIAPDEATRRVDAVLGQIRAAEDKAKQAADEARKAGSMFAIFTFLSMLVGAFIASASAALGGKRRDEY